MKDASSLSVCVCNMLKPRAHGKLPSFPRVFLESTSCFEVFLNLIKHINFHSWLQRYVQSEDLCHFMNFLPVSH